MKTLLDPNQPISSQNLAFTKQVFKVYDRIAGSNLISVGHKSTLKAPKSLRLKFRMT